MEEIKLLQKQLSNTTSGAEKLPLLLKLSQKLLQAHLENSFSYSRQAEELAIKLLDNNSLAEAYRLQGLGYYYKGECIKALQFVEKAKDLFVITGNDMGLANVLNNIGAINIVLTELDVAITAFEEALLVFRKENSLVDIAKVLNNISIPYKTKGEQEKALAYLDECMDIYVHLSDAEGVTKAKANKAAILFNLTRYEEALQIYLECLDEFETQYNRVSHADMLTSVSNCYNRMENYPACLKYLHMALREFTSLDLKRGMVAVYNDVANTLASMGGYEEAERNGNKAIRILEETGDKGEMYTIVTHSLGSICLSAKKYEKAEQYLLQALEQATKQGVARVIPLTRLKLAELYETTGRLDKVQVYKDLMREGELV